MKAVIADAVGEVSVHEIPKPVLKDSEILVEVKAVAINPSDWKNLYNRVIIGERAGCDFSGLVSSIPLGSTSPWHMGERVAGTILGGRCHNGSFAEFLSVDAHLVWRVPENLGWEEAAAMGGVAAATAVQAIYFLHGLNLPTNPTTTAEPVLVWAGSTSVGLYAIQLLKLSGYTVITTASPKNFDLVKSLGADDVYPHSDPSIPDKISAKYPTLSKGIDTFGAAVEVCESLGKEGKNKFVWSVLPAPEGVVLPEDVSYKFFIIWNALGYPMDYAGSHLPSDAHQLSQYKSWLKDILPDLVESGRFKSNPLLIKGGGLEGIQEDLDLLKSGTVSGHKIVVDI